MSQDEMIIVEMKKHFQLRAIEWWSALTLASWGLMVLLFPQMFRENGTAHVLLEIAPQHVWGLAALAAGSTRVVALFVNGLWHRTPAIRWVTAMISIFIWFMIASSFARSSIISTGIVVYSWYMLADMYSAFRSASDFIEAEAQRKLRRMGTSNELSNSREGSNVSSISSR